MYFREVGNKQEKKKILQSLTKGKEQVFTATNALGLGIDAPTIRVVIHVGLKEKIRDYSQESGRAGRDGLKSEAIIMRSFTIRAGRREVVKKGWNIEAGMQEFLDGDICRRVVLDREMDGRVDRLGCEIGEEKCDICQQRPRGEKRRRDRLLEESDIEEEADIEEIENRLEIENRIEIEMKERENRLEIEMERAEDEIEIAIERSEGGERDVSGQEWQRDGLFDTFEAEIERHSHLRRRAVEERVREGIRVEELDKAFGNWVEQCVWCKIQGKIETVQQEHKSWRECGEMSGEDREKMEIAWKSIGEVSFERFAGCSFCLIPQKICHLWEELDSRGPARYRRRRGGECQYEGLLKDVMAGIMVFKFEEDGIEWVENEQNKVGFSNGEEGSWERLRDWMGRKVVVNGVEMSEMCRMFYFLE